MKKTFFLIAIICLINPVFAQKKKAGSEKPDNSKSTSSVGLSSVELQKRIIRKAVRYQDPGPISNSYYNIMALFPDSTQYLDSLAFLYFQVGRNQQCILVSGDILKENPGNMGILELKAVSEKNLGLIKMSLEDFESLFPNSNNIQHQYQIASLQYDLKRLGECQLTIKNIFSREDLKEAKVTVFYGQGQSQSVSMESAIFNMQGVILMDLNEDIKAMEMFDKSLEIEAEFALAVNNKKVLENRMSDEKTPQKK